MATGATIQLKRAYDTPAPEDGIRILVERLWPRGVRKEQLAHDHWAKQIAPSPELRTWYGHDPARWEEFSRRYRAELDANTDELAELMIRVEGQRVTFLFAARDVERNSAVVLRAYLLERV